MHLLKMLSLLPRSIDLVKLELDGREVDLPELESIVVLNINRYRTCMGEFTQPS